MLSNNVSPEDSCTLLGTIGKFGQKKIGAQKFCKTLSAEKNLGKTAFYREKVRGWLLKNLCCRENILVEKLLQ